MVTANLVTTKTLVTKKQLTGALSVYEHLHPTGQESTWHYDLPGAGRYRIVGFLRGQVFKFSGVLSSAHYFDIKTALFIRSPDGSDAMVPGTELNIVSSSHGQWAINHQALDWLIEVDGSCTIDIRCALFWVGPAPTPQDWLGICGGDTPSNDGPEGRTWFRVEGPLP